MTKQTGERVVQGVPLGVWLFVEADGGLVERIKNRHPPKGQVPVAKKLTS